MVRQGSLDGEVDAALQEMQLASDHLLGLLDAILDAHRAEEGTLTLSEDDFALHDVLMTSNRIAEGLCRRKGLEFVSRLDLAANVAVTGDAVRLRQICVNLLDNAVKFTSAGSVRFEAEIEEAEGSVTLLLTVADSGPGIPQHMIDGVFERYSAARTGGDQGAVGGLGIGLSTTRTLTEMMGGAIELTSREGEGTEVAVRLPLLLGEVVLPALEAPRRSGPPRILIVDDNAPNRMVAEAMVKLTGAETTLCCDGVEAVEAAEADLFDLILMDISMPRMDGTEATRRIRRLANANAGVPILAVTAHVSREDVPPLLAEGFDEVIHKPIRKDTITAALERWLDESEVQAQAQPVRRQA